MIKFDGCTCPIDKIVPIAPFASPHLVSMLCLSITHATTATPADQQCYWSLCSTYQAGSAAFLCHLLLFVLSTSSEQKSSLFLDSQDVPASAHSADHTIFWETDTKELCPLNISGTGTFFKSTLRNLIFWRSFHLFSAFHLW